MANGISALITWDLAYSSSKELFTACLEARERWFQTRESNAYKLTEASKRRSSTSVSSSKDPM